MIAYPWLHVLNFLHVPGSKETHLRSLNAVALLLLAWVTWGVGSGIILSRSQNDGGDAKQKERRAVGWAQSTVAHVVFNIALFPPLFFFNGLFYTDVISALLVLLAHQEFYARRPARVLLFSLASLSLRQTNVLWTAVYLGALEVRRVLDDNPNNGKVAGTPLDGRTRNSKGWSNLVRFSWETGRPYDVPVGDASFEGWFDSDIATIG